MRSLWRQPGCAATAIITLAVGIGATAAIFSTVNAAVLRPLPYPGAENLYAVYTPATDGRFTTGRCSGGELARLNVPSVSIVRAAGASRIDTTILRHDGTAIGSVGYGVVLYIGVQGDAIIGTIVGVGLAYAGGRAGSSLLYEVNASDPWILLSATATVAVLTFVAILIPARRASLAEPSAILRQE